MCLQGGEGDDEFNDGVVVVVYEEVFVQVKCFLLVGDEIEMVEVDGRDDQGDEGIVVVVFCIGEDGKVGILEFFFNVIGDVVVEVVEDNVVVGEFVGFVVVNDQVVDIGSDRLCLFLFDSVVVFFFGGLR